MKTLLLIGIVEALFIIILIVSQKQKLSTPQWILLAWLVSIALLLTCPLVSFSDIQFPKALLPVFFSLCALPLLQGPLILLYTQSALLDWKFSWLSCLHLIPFVSELATITGYHFFLDNNFEFKGGLLYFQRDPLMILNVLSYLQFASIPVYAMVSLNVWYKSRKTNEQYYSDLENINRLWMGYFLVGTLIGSLIIFGMTPSIVIHFAVTVNQVVAILAFVYVVLVFHTGYINYRQQELQHEQKIGKKTGDNDSPGNPANKRYKKSSLTDAEAEQLKQELLSFFERDKPYLASKINLHQVAIQLNTSANHLSQVINSRLNKNFFRFINEFRVREFEIKIKDPALKNYTLEGVAAECGFTSRSAFYTTFKKIKGLSPQQYILAGEPKSEINT